MGFYYAGERIQYAELVSNHFRDQLCLESTIKDQNGKVMQLVDKGSFNEIKAI